MLLPGRSVQYLFHLGSSAGAEPVPEGHDRLAGSRKEQTVHKARYLAQTTILAAALAAGAAACGSSTSSDPLAGLTSKQIATQAVTGTEAASSVRIYGQGSDSGQPLSIDLTIVKGKGCQGSFSEGNVGSFKLVYMGGTVWVLPDNAFYQANKVPADAQAILDGKYLEVKSTSNGLGSIAQVCTMSTLLGTFVGDAGTTKGVKTTLNGQPAYKIADKTDAGFAYVTDAAPPQLLQVVKPGSGGGTINFSYGTTTTITPPPASQVIDGSKYGF
jgi:hypothetical protein